MIPKVFDPVALYCQHDDNCILLIRQKTTYLKIQILIHRTLNVY